MTQKLRLALIATTAIVALPAFGAAMPQTQTAPAAAAIDPAPLLEPWTGPYGGVPPWQLVKPAMFPPAFDAAMTTLRTEIHAIRDAKSMPSFETVIVPLQLAGDTMDRVQSMWGVYTSNLATKEVQAIDKEWSPKLTAFYDELFLDPKLFARVKGAYDSRASQKLDAQQLRLLERTYRSFVRRGAALTDAQRAEVARLNQALATQFSDFSGESSPMRRRGSCSIRRRSSPGCPTASRRRSRRPRKSAICPANGRW